MTGNGICFNGPRDDRFGPLIDWMGRFGPRATNTFWEGDKEEHYTWKNTRGSQTQIDYLFANEVVGGYSTSLWPSVASPPDHALLIGEFELKGEGILRTPYRQTLKGWQPRSGPPTSFFRRECDRLASELKLVEADLAKLRRGELRPAILADLEHGLLAAAQETPHTTLAQRRLQQRFPEGSPNLCSRSALKRAHQPDRRKQIKAERRRAYRQRRRDRKAKELANLPISRLAEVPDNMQINGEQVTNRKFWLVGAQQFLAEKFAEPLNPIEEQKLRVAMLEEMGGL